MGSPTIRKPEESVKLYLRLTSHGNGTCVEESRVILGDLIQSRPKSSCITLPIGSPPGAQRADEAASPSSSVAASPLTNRWI